MAFDEAELVARYEQTGRPSEVVHDGQHGQDAQPEPHENVDDLVEEVDAEHALHCPVVLVANLANL